MELFDHSLCQMPVDGTVCPLVMPDAYGWNCLSTLYTRCLWVERFVHSLYQMPVDGTVCLPFTADAYGWNCLSILYARCLWMELFVHSLYQMPMGGTVCPFFIPDAYGWNCLSTLYTICLWIELFNFFNVWVKFIFRSGCNFSSFLNEELVQQEYHSPLYRSLMVCH